jgi:hypothetical protein
MYKVNIAANRWKYFDTLEDARAFCNWIFERTNIVLAIVGA